MIISIKLTYNIIIALAVPGEGGGGGPMVLMLKTLNFLLFFELIINRKRTKAKNK